MCQLQKVAGEQCNSKKGPSRHTCCDIAVGWLQRRSKCESPHLQRLYLTQFRRTTESGLHGWRSTRQNSWRLCRPRGLLSGRRSMLACFLESIFMPHHRSDFCMASRFLQSPGFLFPSKPFPSVFFFGRFPCPSATNGVFLCEVISSVKVGAAKFFSRCVSVLGFPCPHRNLLHKWTLCHLGPTFWQVCGPSELAFGCTPLDAPCQQVLAECGRRRGSATSARRGSSSAHRPCGAGLEQDRRLQGGCPPWR